jgi:hypothetical protein
MSVCGPAHGPIPSSSHSPSDDCCQLNAHMKAMEAYEPRTQFPLSDSRGCPARGGSSNSASRRHDDKIRSRATCHSEVATACTAHHPLINRSPARALTSRRPPMTLSSKMIPNPRARSDHNSVLSSMSHVLTRSPSPRSYDAVVTRQATLCQQHAARIAGKSLSSATM